MTTYDTYEDVSDGFYVKDQDGKLLPFKKSVRRDFSTKKKILRDAIGRIILFSRDGKEMARAPTDPEMYAENLGAEQSGFWGN